MQFKLIFVVCAALVPSACLAAPSIVDQLNSAYDLVQGRPEDPNRAARFPVTLAKDLSGTWFDNAAMASNTDLPGAITSACASKPVKIDATDPFDLKLSEPFGAVAITVELKALGDNLYGMSVDLDAARQAFQTGKETPEQLNIRVLQLSVGWNSTATLMRPSPDILIMQRYDRPARIMGRCPLL